MNHIFKKVWNKSLGRMVVVSENAKSSGKTDNTTGTVVSSEAITTHSGTYRVLGLQTLVLSIAMITGSHVWAAVCDADGSGGTGGSTATGLDAFACGTNNTATGNQSIAIGISNKASDIRSSAIGNSTQALGTNSTAVGSFASALQQSSTVIGGSYDWGNTYVTTNGSQITAIGYGGTVAGSEYATVSVTATGLTTDTITHINGVAVNQQQVSAFVESLRNGASTTSGNFATVIGLSNIAAGAASSNAIGILNTVTGNYSTSIGQQNVISSDNSVIVGVYNKVSGVNSTVIGAYSAATAENAAAIGYNSLADEANTVSVGRAGATKRITNVAAASNGTDAVNLTQVQGLLAGAGIPTSNPAVMYDNVGSTEISLNGLGGTTIHNLKAGVADTDAVNVKQLKTVVQGNNYAHNSSDTALGAGIGVEHIKEMTAGKITKVAGINVTTDPLTTGTSLDDIDSFSINGVTTTKAADPDKVAAFINAAKEGGNIAFGNRSTAVGNYNIASGQQTVAIGHNNDATALNSTALGNRNKATGTFSSAIGIGNQATNNATSAVGYANIAQGSGSSAVGNGNTVTLYSASGSAMGTQNSVTANYGSAVG